MRQIVMFDLPTGNKKERKEYSLFRKFLLTNGYEMLQYSVYSKIFNNKSAADCFVETIRRNLPSYGSIRVLTLTEKQFAGMDFVLGEKTLTEEIVNIQLFLDI